jgi:hypothetical protein
MRRITIFCYIIKGEGRAVSVAKLLVRYYYICINCIFSMASPSMWQLLIPLYLYFQLCVTSIVDPIIFLHSCSTSRCCIYSFTVDSFFLNAIVRTTVMKHRDVEQLCDSSIRLCNLSGTYTLYPYVFNSVRF